MPLRLKARSKYGAVKTTIDGLTFASKKEAARYRELRLLERAREIEGLEVQPKFPLVVASGVVKGAVTEIGCYVADFRYFDRRFHRFVTEDVKGHDTPLSKWKRKHVSAQYGVEVRIV